MAHPPISIRLSDRTYEVLSAEAKAHNRSVGQVIRELADQGAVALRRAQILAEGKMVAARYYSNPAVREFYDDIASAGAQALESGFADEPAREV